MSPIVDWYIDQLAAYGIVPVIAVETLAIVATTCATGLAIHLAERRRDRRRLRSSTPAAPDNQPGNNPDTLWTCRHIWAASHHPARKEKPQP